MLPVALIVILTVVWIIDYLDLYLKSQRQVVSVPMGLSFKNPALWRSFFRIAVSIIFLTVLLFLLFLVSSQLISTAMDFSTATPSWQRSAFAALSFVLFSLHLHYFCYCFGGLVATSIDRCLGVKSWSKLIDYPYYLFSAAILAILIFELSGGPAPTAVTQMRISGALYLLAFKILKTSLELHPEIFASREVPIRSISGKVIRGESGWMLD